MRMTTLILESSPSSDKRPDLPLAPCCSLARCWLLAWPVTEPRRHGEVGKEILQRHPYSSLMIGIHTQGTPSRNRADGCCGCSTDRRPLQPKLLHPAAQCAGRDSQAHSRTIGTC